MRGQRVKAQKTIVDGITFPSKLEAAVYCHLKIRIKSGELKELRMQHRVTLEDAIGRQNWKVDFSAIETATNDTLWIEAKGNLEDRRYIRNRSLWRKNGPGRLEVWSGSYKSPVLVETVFPKGVK